MIRIHGDKVSGICNYLHGLQSMMIEDNITAGNPGKLVGMKKDFDHVQCSLEFWFRPVFQCQLQMFWVFVATCNTIRYGSTRIDPESFGDSFVKTLTYPWGFIFT